jgi:hypothetical protein
MPFHLHHSNKACETSFLVIVETAKWVDGKATFLHSCHDAYSSWEAFKTEMSNYFPQEMHKNITCQM